MSLNENEIRIIDYLDGKLPSTERAALECHFRVCRECREALQDAQEGHRSIQSLSLGGSPDFTKPILNRINQIPRPVTKAGPLSWVAPLVGAIVILAGIFVVALRQVPQTTQAPQTSQASQASQTHQTPQEPQEPQEPQKPQKPQSLEAPDSPGEFVPVKPPTVVASAPQVLQFILARAEGSWSSQEIGATGPVPSGATLVTGENGRLEFIVTQKTADLDSGSGTDSDARIILLPGSRAVFDFESVCLETGSGWFKIPQGSLPRGLRVRSGGVRIQAPFAQAERRPNNNKLSGTQFGVSVNASGLSANLFEGFLQIHLASESPVVVRAFEEVMVIAPEIRLVPPEIRVVPFSGASISPWKEFLDNHLRDSIAPLEKPAQPTVASGTEPKPFERRPSNDSEQTTGTGGNEATGSGDPIDTLLRHQPSQD